MVGIYDPDVTEYEAKLINSKIAVCHYGVWLGPLGA